MKEFEYCLLIKGLMNLLHHQGAMSCNQKQNLATLDHISIEVSIVPKSIKFYDAVAKGLGLMQIFTSAGWRSGTFMIWIGLSDVPRVFRKPPTAEEMAVAEHAAIHVTDRESVDAFDQTMREAGFKPLFPAEEHPEFGPSFYAVSYCDPDNFVLEVSTKS
jgi:catechol 2,3-dioxygenase-like lactoylglutathione lyase family enzyme